MTYLTLLRGLNVGGNSLIKMADLAAALEASGFTHVRTYIQSGNVFFESPQTDKLALAAHCTQVIADTFHIATDVVVFSKADWQAIIDHAPAWWGKDSTRKHNLLVLIPPFAIQDVRAATSGLKADVEAMEAGEGVLYQSMSLALRGRTTTGKLASSPLYKHMTVRNYNTANKLLTLF